MGSDLSPPRVEVGKDWNQRDLAIAARSGEGLLTEPIVLKNGETVRV